MDPHRFLGHIDPVSQDNRQHWQKVVDKSSPLFSHPPKMRTHDDYDDQKDDQSICHVFMTKHVFLQSNVSMILYNIFMI